MRNRLLHVRTYLLALVLALASRSTLAQSPGDCVRLRYTPDSLGIFMPGIFALEARPWTGQALFGPARFARWWPRPFSEILHQEWQILRGYAGWRQGPSDSLFIEYGEAVTAMPLGSLRLSHVRPGEWRGIAQFSDGGDATPVIRGIAHARVARCVPADTAS